MVSPSGLLALFFTTPPPREADMTGNRSMVDLRSAVLATAGRALLSWAATLAAPALVHASEESGSSLSEVNWTLGVQLISFLLLLAVLYKLMYRPLMGALEGRSLAIQQQLAEAQAAREEAQQALGAMEERIRAAQAEAQALRERALREAA